jgi:acyl-CoA thioester hydrolase
MQGYQIVSQQPRRSSRTVPRPDEFPHKATDTIRFGDLDPQGHVNNAVYASYFETGRETMFRRPDLGVGVAGGTFVLAHTEISFLRQLRWPGTVEIGTAIARFGRTSFTVDQAIFSDDVCVATGNATMVLIDKAGGVPQPLPKDAITYLSQWKRQNDSHSSTTDLEENRC